MSRGATLEPIDLTTWQDDEPPPREWIVPGLIPRRAVTTLWGPGGAFKTTLAMDLQAALAATPLAGEPRATWCGVPVGRGASLGVYTEDDYFECVRRIRTLGARRGQSMADLAASMHVVSALEEESVALLTDGAGPDEDYPGVSGYGLSLMRTTWDLDPCLIVLDHLQNFYAADNIDRNRIARFMRYLGSMADAWNCAILLIAHPSLDGAKQGRGYGGSAAWHDYSRSRLYIEPVGKPDDAGRQRLLLSSKKSNYGPPGQSITLLAGGEGFSVIEGVARSEPKTSARQRIGLAALRKAIAESPETNGDDDRCCTLIESWRAEAYAMGITSSDADAARRQAFHRTLRDMKEAGLIVVSEPFVSLA